MRNLVLLAWPLAVAGCSATLPRGQLTPIATVTAAGPGVSVGQPFVDFQFVDRNGKPGRFGNELGDYTVLAFLSGKADADQPALNELQAMLAASTTDDNVHVVGVAIGAPGTKVDVFGPLGVAWFVADNGDLHRAYGAETEDWLFVIGPSHTIVLAAPADQATELAGAFKAAIDDLSDARVAAAFDSDNGFV